jgi:hypothetical protein
MNTSTRAQQIGEVRVDRNKSRGLRRITSNKVTRRAWINYDGIQYIIVQEL